MSTLVSKIFTPCFTWTLYVVFLVERIKTDCRGSRTEYQGEYLDPRENYATEILRSGKLHNLLSSLNIIRITLSRKI
jgi:hypothetical protein